MTRAAAFPEELAASIASTVADYREGEVDRITTEHVLTRAQQFTRKVGQSTISDKKPRDLIIHTSKCRFRNSDFEYPDLLMMPTGSADLSRCWDSPMARPEGTSPTTKPLPFLIEVAT